jgi:hypothetical protein
MLRVKPDDDLSDVRANWLDDAPVDLIVGEDGTFGIGGNWIVPAYAATAEFLKASILLTYRSSR